MNEPQGSENRVRIERLETDLSTLTNKVIGLSDIVTATNTNIENLITQVSSMSTRTQPKATNWTVIFAGITLLVLISTLALVPMYNDLNDQQDFDEYVMQHLENDAREMGMLRTNQEWLTKMEERLNNRIHKGLIK